MFERYTEKARRVIFFARYEASQFGSPYIETEHLLLGILREGKALTHRFIRAQASVEAFPRQIEEHTTVREKVATSIDLPLSNEGKRVLAICSGRGRASFALARCSRGDQFHPAGAEIDIHGSFFGSTPAELPLPTGERTVQLTKKGMHPGSQLAGPAWR